MASVIVTRNGKDHCVISQDALANLGKTVVAEESVTQPLTSVSVKMDGLGKDVNYLIVQANQTAIIMELVVRSMTLLSV